MKNVNKVLALDVSEICSDGTTLYRCNSSLENAFESVEIYTFHSAGTKIALPKLKEQSVLYSLSEQIAKLGVHSVEKPFALSPEICSRWARKYTTSTKDLELAVVVNAYLSRELLRLRVFLGAANKESRLETEILNEKLQKHFKNSAHIQFQYSGGSYSKIAPAHELLAVLLKINNLTQKANRSSGKNAKYTTKQSLTY